MSDEMQPILLEDLKIALPGIVLRRVALNRHMPRVEKLGRLGGLAPNGFLPGRRRREFGRILNHVFKNTSHMKYP